MAVSQRDKLLAFSRLKKNKKQRAACFKHSSLGTLRGIAVSCHLAVISGVGGHESHRGECQTMRTQNWSLHPSGTSVIHTISVALHRGC